MEDQVLTQLKEMPQNTTAILLEFIKRLGFLTVVAAAEKNISGGK